MEDPLLQKGESVESDHPPSAKEKVVVKKGGGNGGTGHSIMGGGAINCLLAVDNLIRGTTDFGTPRKISLVPLSEFNAISDKDKDQTLLLPLQNTRHLFLREYNKPFKWATQATRKFQILNSSGDCIYFGAERSSVLTRSLFLRGLFPYSLSILSLNGELVMELQGSPVFLNNCLTIRDPSKQVIGRIRKRGRGLRCRKSFSLQTPEGTEILNIQGPEGSNCLCCWGCGGEEGFDINLGDGGTSIGKIGAEWDYVLEDLTGLFVPMRLDEMTMSILLGAVFLIDLNFYQKQRDASCLGRCFLTFFSLSLFILLLFLIAKK